MTRQDRIVDEVRKHREAIAREHGNDLKAIVAALEGDESLDAASTVSLSPKRTVGRMARKTRRPNRALEPTARS